MFSYRTHTQQQKQKIQNKVELVCLALDMYFLRISWLASALPNMTFNSIFLQTRNKADFRVEYNQINGMCDDDNYC